MSDLFRVILLLNWLIAVAWLSRVLVWRSMLRRVPDLARNDDRSSFPVLPSLTVIVPARNEAANIAATLDSLLHIDNPALEIVAVDDRSTDETGSIMDRMAATARARSKGMRVLHIAELPQGWLGKTHAMAMGAREAAGEWLLFTDGDVLFHRDALRRASQFAITSGADHMVLLPTILLWSAGERMMVALLQVLSLWAFRPWRVPDPKNRRDFIGVGAFNMIRREVYDAIGGWQSLRMEVLEDLGLGFRVKRSGFAQRVAFGRGLISVRWAQGAIGAVENLTKNLFALFRFRPQLLLSFAFIFALFTLFPFAAFFLGHSLRYATAVMVGALVLAYQRAGKEHGFSPLEVLTFPIASLLLLYALLRSMLIALWRGGISWRGTFYSLRELRGRTPGPFRS